MSTEGTTVEVVHEHPADQPMPEITLDGVPVEGQEPEIKAEPEKEVEAPEVVAPATEEPQEYTPDFSYKVYNEQREIPEFLRSLVTDKETEEQVRAIMCKADALDPMREKQTRIVKERDELLPVRDELNELRTGLSDLRTYSEKDLDRFFEAYKIPEDKLVKWVSEKLKYQDLMPEERQAYDESMQAKRQAYDLQRQLDDQKQTTDEMIRQQGEANLQQAITRPEVNNVRAAFDEAHGPNAFYNEVIKHGTYMNSLNLKQNLPEYSLDDAVTHVHKLYSVYAPQQPPATAPAHGATVAPDVPTLPNIGGGRSVSPTKPVFKSVDDMRKHYKDKYGEA